MAADTSKDELAFRIARYAALTSAWTHQNTTRFQWLPVTFTAALVFVSFVVAGHDDEQVSILTRRHWGAEDRVQWGAGVPLMLAGVGTAILAYTMRRSRRVMGDVEREITKIETRLGVASIATFARLNNPSGFKASTLIRGYMLLLAAAITAFASLLMFDWPWGGVIWLGLVLAWVGVELSPLWLELDKKDLLVRAKKHLNHLRK